MGERVAERDGEAADDWVCVTDMLWLGVSVRVAACDDDCDTVRVMLRERDPENERLGERETEALRVPERLGVREIVIDTELDKLLVCD